MDAIEDADRFEGLDGVAGVGETRDVVDQLLAPGRAGVGVDRGGGARMPLSRGPGPLQLTRRIC